MIIKITTEQFIHANTVTGEWNITYVRSYNHSRDTVEWSKNGVVLDKDQTAALEEAYALNDLDYAAFCLDSGLEYSDTGERVYGSKAYSSILKS